MLFRRRARAGHRAGGAGPGGRRRTTGTAGRRRSPWSSCSRSCASRARPGATARPASSGCSRPARRAPAPSSSGGCSSVPETQAASPHWSRRSRDDDARGTIPALVRNDQPTSSRRLRRCAPLGVRRRPTCSARGVHDRRVRGGSVQPRGLRSAARRGWRARRKLRARGGGPRATPARLRGARARARAAGRHHGRRRRRGALRRVRGLESLVVELADLARTAVGERFASLRSRRPPPLRVVGGDPNSPGASAAEALARRVALLEHSFARRLDAAKRGDRTSRGGRSRPRSPRTPAAGRTTAASKSCCAPGASWRITIASTWNFRARNHQARARTSRRGGIHAAGRGGDRAPPTASTRVWSASRCCRS